MSVKVVSPEEAVGVIKNGDVVTICGVGMHLLADKTLSALERRFLATGEPRDLTLINPVRIGATEGSGLEHFAHEGLVKMIISSSFPGSRVRKSEFNGLIFNNKVKAYIVPMGTLYHLFHAIGAGRPALLTPVGLNTFADPRLGGGKLNEVTQEDIVKIVHLNGEEYLCYKSFSIDVAIIRGTTSDERGNIQMEKEALRQAILAQAIAARNSGGRVIAQVERIAAAGSLHPRLVEVPGFLVNAVVVDENQKQVLGISEYNPGLSGEIRVPVQPCPKMPLDGRKVIIRRAAMELRSGQLVNLGVGLPFSLPQILDEEDIGDLIGITVEHGSIGGKNMGGWITSTHINPEAILDATSIFEFYDGGGLDVSLLGFAQVDKFGNVNVSKFGSLIPGFGGFVNISQATRKILFCGLFTGGGSEVQIQDGKVNIIREGKHRKFIDEVGQICFNAREAKKKKQEAMYITERGVFSLNKKGLVLTEVAPGVEIEKHIQSQMEFKLTVSGRLIQMKQEIFDPKPLGLKLHL